MLQRTIDEIEQRVRAMVVDGAEYSFEDLMLIAYLIEGADIDRLELAEVIKQAKARYNMKASKAKLHGLLKKLMSGKKLSKKEQAELQGIARKLPEATREELFNKYISTNAYMFERMADVLPVALDSIIMQVEAHKRAVAYIDAVERGLEKYDKQRFAIAKSRLLRPGELTKFVELIKAGNISSLAPVDNSDKELDLNIVLEGLESNED